MDGSDPAPDDPPVHGVLATETAGEAPVAAATEPVVLDEVCGLNPAICKAWILSGLFTTTLLSVGAFAGEYFLLRPRSWYPLMTGASTAIVAGVLLVITISMPRLWFRAWRYSIREHDVVIEHGVLWRVIRSVPRLRIQHVDISRDPLDRMLGLASVTLYTAGSGGEVASIPGLTPGRAETLREELLIRKDAADTPHEIESAGPPESGPRAASSADPRIDPALPDDATGAPLA